MNHLTAARFPGWPAITWEVNLPSPYSLREDSSFVYLCDRHGVVSVFAVGAATPGVIEAAVQGDIDKQKFGTHCRTCGHAKSDHVSSYLCSKSGCSCGEYVGPPYEVALYTAPVEALDLIP